MQGSIRFFAGLLFTIGAIGGGEVSVTNAGLATAVALAVVGLGVMYSGVQSMKKAQLAS